jgi:hypothetical protein
VHTSDLQSFNTSARTSFTVDDSHKVCRRTSGAMAGESRGVRTSGAGNPSADGISSSERRFDRRRTGCTGEAMRHIDCESIGSGHQEEEVMSTTTRTILAGVAAFFEHAAAVLIGLVLIVIGLGLGVTMIMLPVGVVVGLLGVLMVVGGLFARMNP